MELLDTTDPRAHQGCQTVFSNTGSERELELAERFGIQSDRAVLCEGRAVVEFRRAVWKGIIFITSTWSARGDAEIVHDGKVIELTPGQAWFLPGGTPVERRCNESCRLYFIKFRCEWLPGVDPLLDWPDRRPLVSRASGRKRSSANSGGSGRLPSMKHLLLLEAQIRRWLAEALPDLEQIISAHVQTHSRFERVFELLAGPIGGGSARVRSGGGDETSAIGLFDGVSSGTWG